jgi:hypothetical protein
MRSQPVNHREVARQLRYLYLRRSLLDAAIQLLEKVIRLRKQRPRVVLKKSPAIAGKITGKHLLRKIRSAA